MPNAHLNRGAASRKHLVFACILLCPSRFLRLESMLYQRTNAVLSFPRAAAKKHQDSRILVQSLANLGTGDFGGVALILTTKPVCSAATQYVKANDGKKIGAPLHS